MTSLTTGPAAGNTTENTAATPPLTTRDNYTERAHAIIAEADQRAAKRQHKNGRKTARERIAALMDPGSFSEVYRFAGGNVDTGDLGSAVITGFGGIDGRTVAVYAQDFSVGGGTLGKVEGDKIVHLMDQAIKLQIPIVAIVDSGGARIQDGVAALAQYGRIFRKSSEASGVVPQISLILGPCAGGAVYGPALTDFIIMTKGSSYMFVTGPTVVKAATGEDISSEDLGGASLHNEESGVAHFLAEDEDEALDYARTLLSYLPSNCTEPAPRFAYEFSAEDEATARAVADLVPEETKIPYDVTDVIILKTF